MYVCMYVGVNHQAMTVHHVILAPSYFPRIYTRGSSVLETVPPEKKSLFERDMADRIIKIFHNFNR